MELHAYISAFVIKINHDVVTSGVQVVIDNHTVTNSLYDTVSNGDTVMREL